LHKTQNKACYFVNASNRLQLFSLELVNDLQRGDLLKCFVWSAIGKGCVLRRGNPWIRWGRTAAECSRWAVGDVWQEMHIWEFIDIHVV